MSFKKIWMSLFTTFVLLLMGCTQNKSQLGSDKNPIKFYLVPAQDILTLTEQGSVLKKYLAQDLGLAVELELPTSYVAVVEAFGSKRADVAILNTLGYILAHEKYGAEAKLKLINRGRDQYYGQIIVREDGPKTLQELNGKKFAFVDPTSVSGYLLPQRLFKQKGIKIKESVFAGKQDTVVSAVYQKQVDGGATFYTPPDEDGTPKDARWLLRTQYPDIYEKVKILQLTDPIPNNPVVFRRDMPEELKTKIIESLKKYIKTPEGAKVMMDLYHITEFREVADKDYDMVRQYLKDVGMKPNDFVQ